VRKDAAGSVSDAGSADATGSAGVSPAPTISAWRSRGYIPHFDAPGLYQHVTFRLADSLPTAILDQWREEFKALPEDKQKAEMRKRVEDFEDAGYGSCILQKPEIARIVQDALLFFDCNRYRLLEWCIMPNHVHVVIEQLGGASLSSILHSWKSYTSKKINSALGTDGQVWMPEYYDRYIRDEKHFDAVCEYIRSNPVKAGLATAAEEWEWGSAFAAR
jgi:REP element-mobilizing transposase RayT